MKRVIYPIFFALLIYSCGSGSGETDSDFLDEIAETSNDMNKEIDTSEVAAIIESILIGFDNPEIDMGKEIQGRYVEPELQSEFLKRITNEIWLERKQKSELTQGLFSTYKTGDSIVSFIKDCITNKDNTTN